MEPKPERCERCGGRLHAMWRKPGTHLTLPLCGECSHRHGEKLLAEGWTVRLFAPV